MFKNKKNKKYNVDSKPEVALYINEKEKLYVFCVGCVSR